jgi:hypothetical protein
VSLQGLSLRKVSLLEQVVGVPVVRATVNNAANWRQWQFTTVDHRHGLYDRASGEWAIYDDRWLCTPVCQAIFSGPDGTDLRPPGSWGVRCPDGVWRVRQEGSRMPRTWPAQQRSTTDGRG